MNFCILFLLKKMELVRMQWAIAKTAHIHFLYGNIHLLKQAKNNNIIFNTFTGNA